MERGKPIHEVFKNRAHRIGVVLSRKIPRFTNWRYNEPVHAFVHQNRDGTSLVQFQRASDPGCWIEFGEVNAEGTENTHYGKETLLKAEDLGAVDAHYHNGGYEDIEIKFRDLFSKTDTKETKKSGGTSTKISLEAEEGVEGFGSIKESLEQEVHAEFAESEGTAVSNEREGEEATVVPPGKAIVVRETRRRVDSELEVTSNADFSFNLRAGAHEHRWNHGWKGKRPYGHAFWNSWQDFCDVVRGEAPDNIELATAFQHHPARHYELDVLLPLDGKVRYKVRFEGKIIKLYDVRPA